MSRQGLKFGKRCSSRRQRSRFSIKRTGVAAVEFALVVPVMLTFVFGLIEISRIALVKESLVQASREGARTGARPSSSADDVIDAVNTELEIMGLTDADVVMEPAMLEQAASGDTIRVTVTIPMATISWVPNFFDFEAAKVEAVTVMRREST